MAVFELIATITGILAVALQTQEKIWAWPIAILSVAISVYVFWDNHLYSDMGLHFIYIILNIYGWFIWSSRCGTTEVVATQKLTMRALVVCASLAIVGSFVLGYFMNNFTNADLAYIDAFTTSTSLVAQYLLAKKYLENWLFWIVVDIVAIPLYTFKELYFFAFLFLIYLLLSLCGYYSWRKEMTTIYRT